MMRLMSVDIDLAEKILAAITALRAQSIRARTEAELQLAVGVLFTEAGIPFSREVEIAPGSRADFAFDIYTPEASPSPPEGPLGRIVAVECKVSGGGGELVSQLLRYAAVERVAGVLLVTTRRRHLSILPTSLSGKPFRAIHVGAM